MTSSMLWMSNPRILGLARAEKEDAVRLTLGIAKPAAKTSSRQNAIMTIMAVDYALNSSVLGYDIYIVHCKLNEGGCNTFDHANFKYVKHKIGVKVNVHSTEREGQKCEYIGRKNVAVCELRLHRVFQLQEPFARCPTGVPLC